MPAKTAADFLQSIAMFAGLPAKELQTLAAAARERRYRPRDDVFEEGEPALSFCLVKSGRVKIVRHARAGKDVVLELLGPGEPFGGVAVIERRPYPASAQATEATVIVQLPQDAIAAVAERHPSIVRAMALLIGQRLRTAHDAVASLAVDPVETRLASTLLRLAERDGERGTRGVTLPFALTRQSLADMTGTTVETTIRVLGRWLKGDVLAEEGGRLVLRDLKALRELAEGAVD